jgi:dynein heavy chain
VFSKFAGISPVSGPVFGETEMTIKGLLFQPGKVQVRFGSSERNQVVVDGEYVDSETIRCKTANYQQFGAMPVDVRVDINGQGWTVNKMTFSYFANTGRSYGGRQAATLVCSAGQCSSMHGWP